MAYNGSLVECCAVDVSARYSTTPRSHSALVPYIEVLQVVFPAFYLLTKTNGFSVLRRLVVRILYSISFLPTLTVKYPKIYRSAFYPTTGGLSFHLQMSKIKSWLHATSNSHMYHYTHKINLEEHEGGCDARSLHQPRARQKKQKWIMAIARRKNHVREHTFLSEQKFSLPTVSSYKD